MNLTGINKVENKKNRKILSWFENLFYSRRFDRQSIHYIKH
jgi:hypothetical protein